jgi:hypothetical protein
MAKREDGKVTKRAVSHDRTEISAGAKSLIGYLIHQVDVGKFGAFGFFGTSEKRKPDFKDVIELIRYCPGVSWYLYCLRAYNSSKGIILKIKPSSRRTDPNQADGKTTIKELQRMNDPKTGAEYLLFHIWSKIYTGSINEYEHFRTRPTFINLIELIEHNPHLKHYALFIRDFQREDALLDELFEYDFSTKIREIPSERNDFFMSFNP